MRYSILTNAPVARLGADLEAVFGAFGPCHAKVSQGKKKRELHSCSSM